METYVPRTLEQMHAIQQKHAAAAAVAAAASASSSAAAANGKSVTGAAAAVAAQSAAAAAAAATASRKRRANAAAAVRADGRQNTQLRSTFLQVGVVSAAVGSSYVERQGTKVLCAIYGPRASSKLSAATPFSERRGAFLCDVRFAPFAGAGGRRSRRGAQASEEEKTLSLLLVEALTVSIHLESFPKAVLEAFVCVLQEDGASSVFPAAVCALSLGLAQAGIMMYDLVAGCAALSSEGRAMLDPSAEEEAEWKEASEEAAAAAASSASDDASAPAACASVSLAYMPSLRQITSVTQSGSAPVGEVSKLTHMCIAGCEQLQGLMKECLMEAAKKKLGAGATQAPAAAATTATR